MSVRFLSDFCPRKPWNSVQMVNENPPRESIGHRAPRARLVYMLSSSFLLWDPSCALPEAIAKRRARCAHSFMSTSIGLPCVKAVQLRRQNNNITYLKSCWKHEVCNRRFLQIYYVLVWIQSRLKYYQFWFRFCSVFVWFFLSFCSIFAQYLFSFWSVFTQFLLIFAQFFLSFCSSFAKFWLKFSPVIAQFWLSFCSIFFQFLLSFDSVFSKFSSILARRKKAKKTISRSYMIENLA